MYKFFFLVTLGISGFASAQDQGLQKCSVDVESEKNIFRVCIDAGPNNPTLIIYRYLSSGEVEHEEFLLENLRVEENKREKSSSFVAKSLGDEVLVTARNLTSVSSGEEPQK